LLDSTSKGDGVGSVKEKRKGGIVISSCSKILEVTWNLILELHVDLARFRDDWWGWREAVREEERMEGKILDRSGMKRMREKGEFNFKKNLKSQMTKMPFKGKDVIVLR
jgi:hypothetical protein